MLPMAGDGYSAAGRRRMGRLLSAQLVGLHDGGVLGEQVGDFPVGEAAGARGSVIGFPCRHDHSPDT